MPYEYNTFNKNINTGKQAEKYGRIYVDFQAKKFDKIEHPMCISFLVAKGNSNTVNQMQHLV